MWKTLFVLFFPQRMVPLSHIPEPAERRQRACGLRNPVTALLSLSKDLRYVPTTVDEFINTCDPAAFSEIQRHDLLGGFLQAGLTKRVPTSTFNGDCRIKNKFNFVNHVETVFLFLPEADCLRMM